MRTLKITHVITGLEVGGAELVLLRLVERLDRAAFRPAVVTLRSEGPIADRIRAVGVPVTSIGLDKNPLALFRLGTVLRRSSPDLVQTWLYHADLLGGLAARAVCHAPVVWGVRQGPLRPEWMPRSLILLARTCGLLARAVPARILVNSQAAVYFHCSLGYPLDRMTVIRNGFDTDLYRPDPEARAEARAELGIGDAPLVGLFGRFHAQKDHRAFLTAAGTVGARFPDVEFLLVGAGIVPDNPQLAEWVQQAGLAGRVHLLGRRDDMARLTAALDVAVSSSLDEGTSNTLGEALACGIPCVATDVGDSAVLVGQAGRIVPPGDAGALAEALSSLLALTGPERTAIGQEGRDHIVHEFSLDAMVTRYSSLYEEVVRDVRHRRTR